MKWPWSEPKPFQEFVGYLEGLTDDRTGLLLKAIQKANDLGLQGKKVKVLEKRNLLMGDSSSALSSIWLIGEE